MLSQIDLYEPWFFSSFEGPMPCGLKGALHVAGTGTQHRKPLHPFPGLTVIPPSLTSHSPPAMRPRF